jgi:hypothetical protein
MGGTLIEVDVNQGVNIPRAYINNWKKLWYFEFIQICKEITMEMNINSILD